jgi:3-methyladenine DNA glycosylase AlkC
MKPLDPKNSYRHLPSMSREPKPFKDHFHQATAQALAEGIRSAWPDFDHARFEKIALADLEKLELLARVDQFADALHACLPPDIPLTIAILQRSLPPALIDCEELSVGWHLWPLGSYIARYGLEHFEEAFVFMTELTQRFTSEFAIRPYAERYPEETFGRLYQLCQHTNPHVRRWCSEGIRPRLPWGRRLHALVQDPTPIWPILEALKDDPELYVRRSVANNLNDIAKDHPELVIARCKKWSRKKTPERSWLIKHALRSLIKAGHPDALALIGFTPPVAISASLTPEYKKVSIGESVQLTANLHSSAAAAQYILLDYVVHFIRKDGSTGAKTFKWTQLHLAPGESKRVDKKHPFRLTTVRTLYPGIHRIELQLNGHILAKTEISIT